MDEILGLLENFGAAVKSATVVLGSTAVAAGGQLAQLTNSFTQTTASFGALSAALDPWRETLGQTFKAIQDVWEGPVKKMFDGLANAQTVTEGLQVLGVGLVETAGGAVKSFANLLSTAPMNAMNDFVNVLKTGGAATAGMADQLKGFATGLTSAVMGPLQGLASAVAPFVEALNPALMGLFNQALRDLMATFGVAFAPIISHVAALFNELSATLEPAMRALSPIMDNLASIMEGTLVPVIGIAVDAFVALAPILQFASSVMASWAETLRVTMTVWRSVFQTLFDVLKGLFGGVDLKGAADGIRDVLHKLTGYFVQFAAYLAKSLGQLGFIDHLIKNLQDLEGRRPGIKAAPQNVHITGLEQIGKDLAVAAFASQGAGGERKKSEAEYLEELVKTLNAIKGEKSKTWEELFSKVADDVVGGFAKALGVEVEALKKFLQGLASTSAGSELKGLIHGLLRRGPNLPRVFEGIRGG